MKRYQMSIHDQLLARIRAEFPEIRLPHDIKLHSYRGPKDAGQYSWVSFITPTDKAYTGPIIRGYDSMTALVKAECIGYIRPYHEVGNVYIIGIA